MQTWYSNTSIRPDEPPRQLWTREEEELFLRRVGHADVVAIGSVRIVKLFSRLDTARRVSVAFRAQQVLHGTLKGLLDDEKQLILPINPGDLDFQMALKTQSHVVGSRYVLLLKLKPGKKQPVLRWAIYRPEQRLLTEIRTMFKWLKKQESREE
jgi:hypothetical protein